MYTFLVTKQFLGERSLDTRERARFLILHVVERLNFILLNTEANLKITWKEDFQKIWDSVKAVVQVKQKAIIISDPKSCKRDGVADMPYLPF